jgi:hypothetical protein
MDSTLRVKKIRPGDDVSSYCGACKAERTHQVVALGSNGTPEQVICSYCGGRHRFRERGGATVRAGGGATRRPVTSRPVTKARPYTPAGSYEIGETIDHPKFGVGEVKAARGGKIEVRFDDGTRVLLHAG